MQGRRMKTNCFWCIEQHFIILENKLQSSLVLFVCWLRKTKGSHLPACLPFVALSIWHHCCRRIFYPQYRFIFFFFFIRQPQQVNVPHVRTIPHSGQFQCNHHQHSLGCLGLLVNVKPVGNRLQQLNKTKSSSVVQRFISIPLFNT